MAGIGVTLIANNQVAIVCGGSIISTRHVLSAGHCPYHEQSYGPAHPEKHIFIGMHDASKIDESMKYDIEKVIMHPHWLVYQTFDAQDMSIYLTEQPIEFNRNVLPICLPSTSKDYSNVNAIVAGWGTVKFKGESSKVLQEVRIKVLDQESCKNNENLKSFFEPTSMMCAFQREKDACQGDSGGPLFLQTDKNRYEQIGVVSFGIKCANNIPGIYTKISTSLEWIHSVIENADVCEDKEKQQQ
uniref:CSON014321 protein n=1 Tax=Culicoides sonorensis TaxID=179676 RepID=A0A336MBD1_CULSO